MAPQKKKTTSTVSLTQSTGKENPVPPLMRENRKKTLVNVLNQRTDSIPPWARPKNAKAADVVVQTGTTPVGSGSSNRSSHMGTKTGGSGAVVEGNTAA